MMENFEQRNADFLKAVEQWRRCPSATGGAKSAERRRGSAASLPFAVKKALTGGAPRFYVTREHAWKMMRERRHRLPPNEKPHRRAMWNEIADALNERQRAVPRESRWEALDHVLVNHRPSGFFLTEEYALRLARRNLKSLHLQPQSLTTD